MFLFQNFDRSGFHPGDGDGSAMDPSTVKLKKKNGSGSGGGDQQVNEDIVPLPIQTFLWRQTR